MGGKPNWLSQVVVLPVVGVVLVILLSFTPSFFPLSPSLSDAGILHFVDGHNRLKIHPKFLHSNATSHKWPFGGKSFVQN